MAYKWTDNVQLHGAKTVVHKVADSIDALSTALEEVKADLFKNVRDNIDTQRRNFMHRPPPQPPAVTPTAPSQEG